MDKNQDPEMDELAPQNLQELRSAVKVGVEELRRGLGTPLDMQTIRDEVLGASAGSGDEH